VLYIYPKTGVPGIAIPEGWNEIPGARGCTPQSCAFRDHHAELTTLGASVFGLSAQGTGYQAELKSRLHLPFEILSDSGLLLMEALRLPVFVCDGETLYRRLTLIVEAGVIRKVFYPVFPPDRNAGDVLAWLRENR
jgi:peroxiredoxin